MFIFLECLFNNGGSSADNSGRSGYNPFLVESIAYLVAPFFFTLLTFVGTLIYRCVRACKSRELPSSTVGSENNGNDANGKYANAVTKAFHTATGTTQITLHLE